jgi:serine/threonine protein phosphatase PrpC
MSANSNPWTALATDIGKRRHNNEDYVLACEPSSETLRVAKGCLYVVADGIGGGAAGEVASRFSAQAVAYHYYLRSGDPATILTQSILDVNAALYDYAQTHLRLATMGTTIVAAVVRGETLHVAHVGDSRAYLIRQNTIHRLTEDHNLTSQLVRDGIITAAQAERHPQKHLLLRSIGGERKVLPDCGRFLLLEGDTLLLCSDGLTRHISDEEIATLVANYDPHQGAKALLETANHRGGYDNVSVLIVRWLSDANVSAPHRGILSEPPPLPDIDEIRLLAQIQSVDARGP